MFGTKQAAALAAALALGACAAAPAPVLTRVVYEKQQVPPDLLRCPPAPAPPPDGAMQSDAADWTARFVVADADCRETLAALAKLFAAAPAAGATRK